MTTLRLLLASCAAGIAAMAPSLAHADSTAYFTRSHSAALPSLLSNEDRLYYGSLFEAIASENWTRVEVLLTERADGPLHSVALARYYLHPNSPRIELGRVQQWLARYGETPDTEAIIRLGRTRGLVDAPILSAGGELVRQPGMTKRILPRTIEDGTMPAEVRAAILERIVADDPDGARLLLDGIDNALSSQARAEWRQRVAWSYYIENRDADAWAMARMVREGSGPWVAEGDWVAGLAAWRLGNCAAAADSFAAVALGGASTAELSTAAHYWAARSLLRCRKPAEAQRHLQAAARYDETLYGMLALEQLGQDLPARHATPDLTGDDWERISNQPAVRQAVMLAEIGRRAEADEALRWQVRRTSARDYPALTKLARALGLAGTQTFMAYNAPRGAVSPPSLRWPVAYHRPHGGWKVDPALAFAHALQESNFRESVVSPANAIGLMQVRPIAAREYGNSIGLSAAADLKDPATNLAFGQRALEALSQSSATRGALPKVMAAYNAGLTPVTRWNAEIVDQNDPLLWMESIPYWETRGYVSIVMRNYWMYLRQADAAAPSRKALAENDWPQFPRTR